MANEDKLTTMGQMRTFAEQQDARDDEQEEQLRNHTHSADQVKFSDGETFQAKYDSGELTGPQGTTGATGVRGTGIKKVTTAPSSYTTATGGFTPTYRISLSTVKTQAGATEILVGDILEYSYYHYPVGYVDSSYVYLGARTSIRGATGAKGATGETGATGKTAYAYAQDGGYTGTEAEFAAKLATEITSITTTQIQGLFAT